MGDKNKMMKRDVQMASTGVVMALLGACLIACDTPPQPEAPDSNSPTAIRMLRVGVSETSPPVIFEEDGKVVGIEADLARALGKALGCHVEFVSMFWPNLLLELHGGRIDMVMSGVSVTERRKARVAFASPYMTIGQQAMVRRTDMEVLGNVEAVLATRRRVGAEVGTTAMRFVHQRMGNANIARFSTVVRAMAALDQGEIDVVVHDSPAIHWYAAKKFGGRLAAVPGVMTHEPVAWAINKNNHELLQEVNDVLAGWHGDGTLDAIVTRWLPDHVLGVDDP